MSMEKDYQKILFQKGGTELVGAVFEVGDKVMGVSASGIPAGGKITFEQVWFVAGTREKPSLCSPTSQGGSKEYAKEPYKLCECTPELSPALGYLEIHRPGFFRPIYTGPGRPLVFATAYEIEKGFGVAQATGCCGGTTADLEVVKTMAPTNPKAGDSVTFTVVARNNGPYAANGTIVKDLVPAGTFDYAASDVVDIAYAGGAAGATTTTLGTLGAGFTIPNFPNGGQATFTFDAFVKASATGAISNTAYIKPPAGITDPDNLNNQASAEATVLVPDTKQDALQGCSGNPLPGGTKVPTCDEVNTAITAVEEALTIKQDALQGCSGNPLPGGTKVLTCDDLPKLRDVFCDPFSNNYGVFC